MADELGTRAMDAAHGGTGWDPTDTTLQEEARRHWGDFGMRAESDPLGMVLLHAPGSELSPYSTQIAPLWDAPVDQSAAHHEVLALAGTFQSLGVRVEFLNPPINHFPNLCFVRDLFSMTPEGAVLSRPASSSRRGEERLVFERLAELGVPVVITPWGRSQFEGPDLVLAGPELALVGHTVRTNLRATSLLTPILTDMGYDVRIVQTAIGRGHLDGCLAILGRRDAMFVPGELPFAAYEALMHHGIRMNPLPPSGLPHGINIVCVGSSELILAEGSPDTEKELARLGFHVNLVRLTEIHKGGGSVHCLSGVISRNSSG